MSVHARQIPNECVVHSSPTLRPYRPDQISQATQQFEFE
jgi:hypothetical protein